MDKKEVLGLSTQAMELGSHPISLNCVWEELWEVEGCGWLVSHLWVWFPTPWVRHTLDQEGGRGEIKEESLRKTGSTV